MACLYFDFGDAIKWDIRMYSYLDADVLLSGIPEIKIEIRRQGWPGLRYFVLKCLTRAHFLMTARLIPPTVRVLSLQFFNDQDRVQASLGFLG